MTTMVYKSPGNLVRKDGTSFRFQVVDDADAESALSDGWFSTPSEAIRHASEASSQDPDAEAKPKRGRTRKYEAL